MNSSEICCDQCNYPVPLLCWRYKIKYILEKSKIGKADNQPKKAEARTVNRKSYSRNQLPREEEKDFSKFAILDEWRDYLIHYVAEESGNFKVNDKQWLAGFYDYEAYQNKVAINEKMKDDNVQKSFNEAHLPNAMRQSHDTH